MSSHYMNYGAFAGNLGRVSAGLFSGLGHAYSAKASGDLANYYSGYASENSQYWSDYTKNTGFSAAYPYRSGVNNTALYNAQSLSAYGSMLRNIGDSISSFQSIYG